MKRDASTTRDGMAIVARLRVGGQDRTGELRSTARPHATRRTISAMRPTADFDVREGTSRWWSPAEAAHVSP